jgi:DNA-binding response OmpR family regulator
MTGLPEIHLGKCLLLIDPDPVSGAVTKGQLTRGGLDVTLVQDGLEARILARRNYFEAVLLDAGLARAEWIDTVRGLRRHHVGGVMPLVALCGADAWLQDCIESLRGVDAVISKPIDASSLLGRLSGILDRARSEIFRPFNAGRVLDMVFAAAPRDGAHGTAE